MVLDAAPDVVSDVDGWRPHMRVVTKVLFGGWAAMAAASGAAAAGNDHRLAVRLYDGFGVSSSHLDRAQSAARDILKNAGLAITWAWESIAVRAS